MDQFEKVNYSDLSPKQQEIYNFQKSAAKLANYGFNCIKLTDDWLGADFLAYRSDDAITLRVQLKGRLTIQRKYLNRGLWMIFPIRNHWYLIEHDRLVQIAGRHTPCLKNNAWNGKKRHMHLGTASKTTSKSVRKTPALKTVGG